MQIIKSIKEGMRRIIGKLIEWFLMYERIVYCNNDSYIYLPFKFHNDDVAYDLMVDRDIVINNGVTDVPTSLYIEPVDRIWFEIKGRSSTFKRLGIIVIDAVIDKGYRGPMFVQVYNPSDTIVLKKNSRIAQVVPHLLLSVKFKYKSILNKSDRGNNGFGSTGV